MCVYWLERWWQYPVPIVKGLKQFIALVDPDVHLVMLLVGGVVHTSRANVKYTCGKFVRRKVHESFRWPPDGEDAPRFSKGNPYILPQPHPPGSPTESVFRLAVAVL